MMSRANLPVQPRSCRCPSRHVRDFHVDRAGALSFRNADACAPRALASALRVQGFSMVAARGLLKSLSCAPSLFQGWSPPPRPRRREIGLCCLGALHFATTAEGCLSDETNNGPTCQMGRACARSNRGGHRVSIRLASGLRIVARQLVFAAGDYSIIGGSLIQLQMQQLRSLISLPG